MSMQRPPVRPVVFASICVAVGCAIAFVLVRVVDEGGTAVALAAVALGTFSSSWLLWSRAYDWIHFHGRIAGGIIGLCACVITQFASWCVWLIGHWAAGAIAVGTGGGGNPFEPLVAAFQMTLLSLIMSGPVTLPAGIVIGTLCAVAPQGPRSRVR